MIVSTPTPRRRRAAFSLAELLVVIGIIAVLGGITTVAIRGIAKDARMSSAENTITASLGEARAMAMKNNRIVAVVFRPIWDDENPETPQFTEVVVAEYSDDSNTYIAFGDVNVLDRFDPIPGIPSRPLPVGIKVAGPWYDLNSQDDLWVTQSEFPAILAENEQAGRFVGVMFGSDGQLLTKNARTGASQFYVDFNGDGDQDVFDTIASSVGWSAFWGTDHPQDENSINPVPFICVYDDEAAREAKVLDWSILSNYENELRGPDGFITVFGRRIHFNRYTGVVITSKEQ